MARTNVTPQSLKARIQGLVHAGQYKEAKVLLDKLVKRASKDPEAWFVRGMVCSQLGKDCMAAESFENVVKLQPGHALSHFNLALIKKKLGAIDEASRSLEKVLKIEPDHVQALEQIALISFSNGETDTAAVYYQQLVQLKPADPGVLANLGALQCAAGELSAAEESYKKAITLAPERAHLHDSLASVLCDMGLLEDSFASHKEAIRLSDDARVWSNYLLSLNYFPGNTTSEICRLHREWGERVEHGAREVSGVKQTSMVEKAKLRIGYVSPDFRTHSVAYFLEPLLAAHDKNAVEVFCYSTSPRCDDTTQRFRKLAAHWREIHDLSDQAVADAIVEDGIDILVDLSGHTAGNRLSLFMACPAPIQVTYLGYPNTTGLSCIDYRITDALADTEGADDLYTEKLLRLSGCFLCYSPPPDAPEVADAPCQRNGYVTFGSFNNYSKINENVTQLWARVLLSVAGSRLLIKATALTDVKTANRCRQMLLDAGIPEDRFRLIGRTKTTAEHLALYRQVDIGLDTFPYNGTTTTCEAMYMGVPVITMSGDRHATRVGSSLLTATGMGRMVADSNDAYLYIARELASDCDRLVELRGGLRQRMLSSPLCDAVTFARDVESAYRKINADR